MTGRSIAGVIFVLSVFSLAGCKQKASQEIDFGGIENSVYRNKYFGLSLPIPPDWSVQDEQMRKQLTEAGAKLIGSDDKAASAVIKASEMRTVNLLAAFKHPIGAAVMFNPSIMCVAERVRDLPGIQRGKDYHFHAKRLMQAGQVKFDFEDDITNESLGGTEFDVMKASLNVGPVTVQQKYYTAILKGYALNFIVSYSTPEEEAELKKILDGMSIEGS